ncbi:hypothetical protein [Pantanalinema sp. GBBB05]|uniref:hypothetical protein n=1 Tax=Pantanalinema sp. GBBB05 TaxID=2604139 RepID=UPI001E010136|nr:hypothetical protein [Pantanalinema sp. GBBB05]
MNALMKVVLIVLLLVVNLAIAPPSWADRPKVSKNPDYVQVTKTLNGLLALQETQDIPSELQQQIDELTLQKAAIESGVTWGQCWNTTGQTIGIFGPATNPKSGNDGLYFLADGETTPEGWDCQGVYLPSGAKVAGIESTPAIFKILDGTRLVAALNSDTGAIEFNVPTTKLTQADPDQPIPHVSQAFIDSRIPSTLIAGEMDD